MMAPLGVVRMHDASPASRHPRRWGWSAVRHSGLIGLSVLVLSSVISSTGCVGAAAQLLYAIQGGDLVPAQYDGLKKKRVAVVCRSDMTVAGYSPECADLQRKIMLLLSVNVKEIDLVDQGSLADWNLEGATDFDPRRIGRAVQADRVVFVELRNFSTRGDKTLYKGYADASVLVYNMEEKGKVDFQDAVMDWSFPKSTGIHTTEMSAERFQEMFVGELAERISRNFYPYDVKHNFGSDARILHN